MLHRFVDGVLAVAKESVKTFTYESLNNIVRLINGMSAFLLTILPGKTTILEGFHGWELRPSFRGPRLPRWMENGVSSFNQFIHELSLDSDYSSSSEDDVSGEEDDDEIMTPGSPLSQASRLSHTSSFSRSRYQRRMSYLIKYLFSWMIWPITFAMGLPLFIYQSVGLMRSSSASNNFTLENEHLDLHKKKLNQIKDHVVHRTTDKRRGIVEDLQLAIEISIEAIFDMFHKAAHFLLSPSEVWRVFSGWFFFHEVRDGEISGQSHVPVPTATLGENDPSLTERQRTFHQSLNTDARTCEDVITEHGYPYEAIRVVTNDGYVLLLERIPRRDSQKVVYLQHGILDSSMGWVSNGVVGSPAFAAFDQVMSACMSILKSCPSWCIISGQHLEKVFSHSASGHDVYLGNLRGLVSREHIDKNISSRRYWRYSINEHGIQDIPAIIEKIHEVKTAELKTNSQSDYQDEISEQPYSLCTVCHSLGGAAMLMYLVTRQIENKPHRLSRIILLSPAGFHDDSSVAFTIVERLLLLLGPIIAPFIPGLYIPTRFFRMLLNKLARDFHNYPALGALVQTLMSYVVGGDSSNWVGVLGLPHYNMYNMPGVSLHVALHLAQMKRAKKFIMYDYGSAAANMEAYGSGEPLDVGQHYNLIDTPVDLVAGQRDQVIRPSMVRRHYRLMRKAGVVVSYNEFEYAHLDFTFSHHEELLAYVMSRLLLVASPSRKGTDQRNEGLRKRRSRSRNGANHAEIADDD